MTSIFRLFLIIFLVGMTPMASVQADSSVFGNKPPVFKEDTLQVKRKEGELLYFNIEIAERENEHQKGLMFRTELAENAGMLFLFANEEMRYFWMKNTLIPLDMLFIGKDGTINHIHHMAKPQDETTITSKYPSMAVLEIKGGNAAKLGINEGDVLIHKTFRNEHLK